MSAPAAKAFSPAPVRIAQRTPASCDSSSDRAPELAQELLVQRVQLVRPVQRDGDDAFLRGREGTVLIRRSPCGCPCRRRRRSPCRSSCRASRRRRGSGAASARGTCRRRSRGASTSAMASTVSRPMRSLSSNGPIGWLRPSFAPVSMSSGVPTPSCSAKHASQSIGMRMRFTRKPGASLLVVVVLPIFSASEHGQVVGLVARLHGAHDLDELHERRRVHEVHADDPVGPRRRRGELRQRDRRRVAREPLARRERGVASS